MPEPSYNSLEAKNLVIFDLPAVVSYDHLPLRKALVQAFEINLPCPPVVQDIDWSENATGVLNQIYQRSCKRLPTPAELENIRKDFHARLKEYFLLNDDPFDVWSGVQNVFESLDRREDWDYVIVSDYWRESTEFILSSCGIFSRKKHLLTADDGTSAAQIIKNFGAVHQLRGDEVLYLMARDIEEVESPSAVNRMERMKPPHRKKADMLEYPRFSKLFTSARAV